MPSDRTALTTLATDLRRLGLNRTADELNDRIAEATRKRWSATVLLEHLVADELEDKQRRSVESRLTRARLGRFKPLADWNWEWPTALDRLALERILTLDFLARGENVILVGAQGLGKTMLAKNIAHQAVLAGHSALFTTAADLLLNLNGQETGRALERRLRHYTRPTLLVIDELGYLAYDARAADLIFQLVSRRYEHRSLLITTNLPFKRWDTVFPNASCAVALIDRLTHHVEILLMIGTQTRSFAIYGLLERQRPGKTKEKTATYDVANRDLASLIDEAVTPFTDLVDWQQKDDLQRQMRSRIKRQLRAGGIDADTVESLAADIVDLAKVRSDR